MTRLLESELILSGEHRPILRSPLAKECEVLFVIPVHDENPQRLLDVLTSLADQWCEPGTVETIVVVNNGPIDRDERRGQEIFERNQAALALPVFRNTDSSSTRQTPQSKYIRSSLAAYVIDRSSPGNWTAGSNVGKARRLGLLEAASRFARAGHNGLVVHTDADCRFDDQQFVSKIMRLFAGDAKLVGLAGAHKPEFDPTDPEAKELVGHLLTYLRFRRYTALARSIRRGHAVFNPEKPLGSCLIHRAFEGVLAGGIDPVPFEEDVTFGYKLMDYATENGMHFAHGRRFGLGPVSAIRVSDRTPNNVVRRFLRSLEPDGSLFVPDVLSAHGSILLDDRYLEELINRVRSLPGGLEQIEYMFFTSALATTRGRRGSHEFNEDSRRVPGFPYKQPANQVGAQGRC
ncbi:hypothetical protein OG216_45885 (plasmid) [Streptomycetaceae bacterium NBC_01309]